MLSRIKPVTFTALLLLLSVKAYADELGADTGASLDVSGSFKSLLSRATTPVREERYWSDLNRLKLNIDGRLNEMISAKAIIDNEFLIGTLIDTQDFQDAKEFRTNTRWDLDNLVADNDDLVWRANVYRAYLQLDFAQANVVAGRQRIAWGTGRIWNPTDLFNPISPLQIERSQREGVDGLSAEYFLGTLTSINLVYALGETSEQNSLALRAGTNVGGYDVGIMGGSFRSDSVIGFDFGGNIGAAGLRGEATFTDPDSGSSFTRLVLSVDYSWPNTVYLLAEYLYNGGNLKGSGVSDAEIEARERFFNGEIITENKNFLATGLGYELTPLLRIDGVSIYDIDEGSIFLTPSLTWNALTNLDLTVGGQFFAGDEDSEYGDNDSVFFTSLKVYF